MPARNAPETLPSPPTTATIKAKMVNPTPAVDTTGVVMAWVMATIPARTPLTPKMTVRTEAGLIPHRRAPSSSWMTDRVARPNVV